MPQGQPSVVPQDGLTTRQRRNRPLLMVHTGEMKGKSTAAFGMALRGWNQGWNIGVFQFVKSAKWKVGEEGAFKALGQLHEATGQGGPVEWHKMGEGWSWSRKAGTEEDHAADAIEGWREIQRRIAARDPRSLRAGRVHLPDEVGLGRRRRGGRDADVNRPGHQYVVITGRNADQRLLDAADLVTEMTKVKHPMDAGQKGQKGIEW